MDAYRAICLAVPPVNTIAPLLYLQEGHRVYTRSGDTFNIPSCFWVFAGTAFPETEPSQPGLSNKSEDFLSRLEGDPFELRLDKDNRADQKASGVEKIYMGGTAIHQCFPDVSKVADRYLMQSISYRRKFHRGK